MIYDDFNSPELSPQWTATNFAPQGPSYSLASNPGNLQIAVPGGQPYDQWVGIDNAPEISRSDMGEGNFAIETSMDLDLFAEGSPFTAGLAVRFGPGDLLIWGASVGAWQLEAVRSGIPRLVWFAGWGLSKVFLRIEKSGNVYSFFHKAAAADRWVADGQYRPDEETQVQSVGFAVKTWADAGAQVTVSFDYFGCIVGTNVSDISKETADLDWFYQACTRWVPEHGPLISIPPNIPGQAVPNKNTRILLPDRIAYDRTDAVDAAPQLYRIDIDGPQWSMETVVTMIYSDPAGAHAGLFIQFTETDAVIFSLSGGERASLYRTGAGEILSVEGFANRAWLKLTRLDDNYIFAYKADGDEAWTSLQALSVAAPPQKAGVIARTQVPTNAAFDFGYLIYDQPIPAQNPITPPLALPAPPPLVPLPTSSEQAAAPADGALILENHLLRLVVDNTTGNILQITNKGRGIDLLDPNESDRPAWKIETEPGSWEDAWLIPTTAGAVFEGTQYPDLLEMVWACPNGITVRAAAYFDADSSDLVFGVEVENTGTVQVVTLEYPRIERVAPLGEDSADDYLLHPFATGFLFKNPVELFPQGGGIPPAPYPEGFNGCTAQLMAYYRQDAGGFSFWMNDCTGWVKWLDCFRPDDRLTLRFMHSAAGIGPGNALALPYTIRVTALQDGTWYEAAERYRAWAKNQVFCALGPLHSRTDKATWLLEDVGLSTFGINTQYDRQPWLEYYHKLTGKPVFHITGPNWQYARYSYMSRLNGGTDGVFPHAVLDSYLETLRQQGDYFAPFSFGMVFSPDVVSADATDATFAYQQIPGRSTPGLANTLSRDGYGFPFLCPVAGALTRMSVYRDAGAVEQLGADAFYYDVGPSNIMLRCLSPDHGHPVGGGNAITDGYKQMLATVREAAGKAASHYIPCGAEMISEVFIPYMDFYQARAEAGPSTGFEDWSFREWIKQGQCEKVPLFAFLYHEYGPTRLDGWGRLDAQQGDLFYWIAGRVYAWGGIYEINCEYSSLDAVDGHKDDITQSYTPYIVDRYYPVDPDKAHFLSQMAIARTTYANRYLAYGEMMRPLAIDVPSIEMGWFHYNIQPDTGFYQDGGVMTVPSVIQSSWRYKTESCGFFFVNLRAETINITVDLHPGNLGIAADSPLHAFCVDSSGTVDLGMVDGPVSLSVSIPGRSPLLLEVKPT